MRHAAHEPHPERGTRSIAITAICIVGFIFSALQLWSMIIPPFLIGNGWRIAYLLNALVYFTCFIGLWMMRRKAFYVLLLNIPVTLFIQYITGIGIFHMSNVFYLFTSIFLFNYIHRLRA